MHLVHKAMELIKQLLTFVFEILILLQFNFVLPFSFLVLNFNVSYGSSYLIKFSFDLDMLLLLLLQLLLLLLCSVKWLSYVLVCPIVLGVLLLRQLFFTFACVELFFEELDDV